MTLGNEVEITLDNPMTFSTVELLDAAAEALEQEAQEKDRSRRALLLFWIRTTLAEWRSGSLTTEEAVVNLWPRPSTGSV
jgi:hypothetical protein